MVRSKWALALIGILAVGVPSIGAARADEVCKEHDARFADLEKRVSQLEEIAKQAPLPASSYRTSTGAVFSRVECHGFGKAWKAPDGMVWSEYQGNFSNDGASNGDIMTDSEATRACAKINGSLPTKQHFERLKRYFDFDSNGYLTAQGRKDLYKVFPDMKGRWFWSSSVRPNSVPPNDEDSAYVFNGRNGHFASYSRDVSYGSVRCVGIQ